MIAWISFETFEIGRYCGPKGDGYEDYMTKFRVNNIKKIRVIKPSDLIDELTDIKENGKKFLPQPKGKDPYTKRNVYGFQKQNVQREQKLIGR